jgi:hypothetical protein
MDSAEIRAFQSNKITKCYASDLKFQKRIHSALRDHMKMRGLYFHPFIFIDDGSFEAEQFLYPCRFEGCLFDPLFDNVFVCGKHLCVHHCKPNSRTCAVIQEMRGAVFCKFSGTDLSRHRALGNYHTLLTFISYWCLVYCISPRKLICKVTNNNSLFLLSTAVGNAAQAEDVECFDNHHGNRYKGAHIQKSHSSQPRRNEILFGRLTSTIEDVTKNLCNLKRRRQYNKLCRKQRSSKDTEEIALFRRKMVLEKSLQIDLKVLCDITLRNTDGKQQTLLLLRNMHSFIYYLTTKIINGIYSQGDAVLKPPSYTEVLRPLPFSTTLRDVFGIKLTKYAECMKCIQYIMEKKSFVKRLSEASNFTCH